MNAFAPQVCILMRSEELAWTWCALKVVDHQTATRDPIDALIIVHTDYSGITKNTSKSITRLDQLEHAHAMTHTSSLMPKRLPVWISYVPSPVETVTASRVQIDA